MADGGLEKPRSDTWKGVSMTVFGATVISTDALLIRYSWKFGGTTGLIFFWKYLVNMCVAFVFVYFVLARGLSWYKVFEAQYRAKWHILGGSLAASLMGVSFTVMFLTTSAADAILLASLGSLWAALIGYFFLGESLAIRTRIALCFALIAIGCIFLPLGGGSSDEEGSHGSTVHGNMIAIGAGLFTAIYVSIQRHGSRIRGSFMPATCVYGVCLSTFAGALMARGDLAPSSLDQRFFPVAIINGLASGIITIVVSVAPRFIPGPEVTLILLLETVLAPLWVYLAFGEVPGYGTMIGGGILLITLVAHGFLSVRAADRELHGFGSSTREGHQDIDIKVCSSDGDCALQSEAMVPTDPHKMRTSLGGPSTARSSSTAMVDLTSQQPVDRNIRKPLSAL